MTLAAAIQVRPETWLAPSALARGREGMAARAGTHGALLIDRSGAEGYAALAGQTLARAGQTIPRLTPWQNP